MTFNAKPYYFIQPIVCFLRDLKSGEMIGNGRVHGGLYLLEKRPQAMLGKSGDVSREVIMWHRRLGHPSFIDCS